MSSKVDLCTPTKTPTKTMASSPVFTKPSDLFKKRSKRKIDPSPLKSSFKTPTKSPVNTAVKRLKLSLEEDVSEKNFSPLKCLQSTSTSSNDLVKSFSFVSPKNKKLVSFSPIFKKLKGSPLRNIIQFPVVGSGFKKHKQTKLNNFSRVLDFSEDANFFTEKFSPTKKSDFVSPVKNSRTSCSISSPNIDWSLKTKLRISINRTLPFNGTFKAVDETIGLNNFVRGCSDSRSNQDKDSFASELYRSSLVWQFPHIPWMKCFPRTLLDKCKTIEQLNLNSAMSNQLYQSYCSSLRSLFKLLKSKHCPFFYVCTKCFTILFRASGIAGEPEPHALISPTTSGLRKAFKNEHIDFTLPFHNRKSPPKLTFSSALHSEQSESGIESSNCEKFSLSDDEDEEEKIDEEENQKWLTSLGLSQDSFISSDSTSIRRRFSTNSTKTIIGKFGDDGIEDISAEGKIKSIAFVRGTPNIQGLLNFLINERKLLVPNSGSLAGIPPTLLAPTAFIGATCTPLELSLKTKNDSQSLSTIEICGPILPSNVFALSELYGQYSSSHNCTGQSYVHAAFKSEESTCSFALEAGIDSDHRQWTPMFSVPNFEDSGLSKSLLQAVCSEDRQLHQPINDIEITTNRIRYNKFTSKKT